MTQVSQDEALGVAAITVSELLVGVHRTTAIERQAKREAYVENALAGIMVVPFDLTVARVHARLAAGLRQAGSSIGANDLLIAATALTHSYAVLTVNARAFSRVPGLEVRTLQVE